MIGFKASNMHPKSYSDKMTLSGNVKCKMKNAKSNSLLPFTFCLLHFSAGVRAVNDGTLLPK